MAVPVTAQVADDPAVHQTLDAAEQCLRRHAPRPDPGPLRAMDLFDPHSPFLRFDGEHGAARLGEIDEARQCFDRALHALAERGDPDPELAARLRRARRDVNPGATHLSLQMGAAYDSNVTFRGLGTGTDLISGDSNGVFATRLQVEHVPVLSDEEAVNIGARLSHAWYFSLAEFDFQDYGVYARYARRIDEAWAFDVQYDYDFALLDNDRFLSLHAVSPRLTRRWQESTSRLRFVQSRIDYRIESQNFLVDTTSDLDRDGFANSVGFLHHVRAQPFEEVDWTWEIQFGQRWESVATEGREFDRIVGHYYVGVQFPLPSPILPQRDLTFQFLTHWQIADYRNKSRFDAARRHRRDVIGTLGVVLSQVLVADAERGDVILHALFNWTDADSNVVSWDRSEPFTYDKIVAGVQLEWRF